MNDPIEKKLDEIHKKLDGVHGDLGEVHEDLKGGFRTLHDRADREGHDRAWTLVGIRSELAEIRKAILEWWRGRA